MFAFTVEDLARTRFAVSPGWELVASLRLLREESSAEGGGRGPWLNAVRSRIAGLDLSELLALVPPNGYVPDFLTPAPDGPGATFAQDIARIRATDPKQVAWELAHMSPPRSIASIDALADRLEAYHAQAVAPDWTRVRALLDAEIHDRAQRLAQAGAAGLFASLHPTISWHDGRLLVDHRLDDEFVLGGRGLTLIPSAFQRHRPAIIALPPWQPTLIYPAKGAEALWDLSPPDERPALGRLLGATRARVLLACATPSSTSELARQLDISPGGTSQHLQVLHAAGLLTARRDGRAVLYRRTAMGDELCGGDVQ